MGKSGIGAMKLAAAVTVSMTILTGTHAPAQSPTFEVASIRPSQPGPIRAGPMLQPSGRLFAINLTLRTLIREAYGLEENQVVGGPSWIDSDGFDVEARATGNASPDQVRLMLRALLASRFALRTHSETRQLPIYDMTLSARDGKPGARMRPSGPECAPLTLPRAATGGGPPPPPPPPELGGVYLGATREGYRCPRVFFYGYISASMVPMDAFARALSQLVDRPIVNRTSLAGDWDIELTYQPDLLDARPSPGPPPPAGTPSLTTALREQLGLKLEARRGPVEVLVIDRAEQPTGN